ncbi:MAG: hypothetical protein ACRDPA_23315, partial [Solirubrobacteraceae bacterium]
IAAGVLATACGAGSPSGQGGRSASAPGGSQALAYARCIRSHGVPSLPDPGASPPSGSYNSFLGIAIPSTIDVQSPAFQSANKTCQQLISASNASKPPITDGQKHALLAQAQCMREHGVPDFPDPTFPRSGGIGIQQYLGNPQSPAFEHAQKVCRTGP